MYYVGKTCLDFEYLDDQTAVAKAVELSLKYDETYRVWFADNYEDDNSELLYLVQDGIIYMRNSEENYI